MKVEEDRRIWGSVGAGEKKESPLAATRRRSHDESTTSECGLRRTNLRRLGLGVGGRIVLAQLKSTLFFDEDWEKLMGIWGNAVGLGGKKFSNRRVGGGRAARKGGREGT